MVKCYKLLVFLWTLIICIWLTILGQCVSHCSVPVKPEIISRGTCSQRKYFFEDFLKEITSNTCEYNNYDMDKVRRQYQKKRSPKNKSFLLVERANSIADPLELLDDAFKTYKSGSLDITLSFSKASDLNPQTMDWIFNLTKSNMKQLYDDSKSGWCSWNDEIKLKEMTGPISKYLIARTTDGTLVGFSHFCFDIDYGVEVLYCYELQLEPSYQRFGIGSFLLRVIEKIAFSNNMKKVILTSLKSNLPAMRFYKSKKYTTDETSPIVSTNKVPTYEILSKKYFEVRLTPHSVSMQSQLVEQAISANDYFKILDSKCKTYCKDTFEVDLISKRLDEVDDATMEWMFQLMKSNMKEMYESSILGWNEEKRRKIVSSENSRFIIVMTKDKKLAGYAQYRFQIKFEHAVVCCKLLHLEPFARRRGLGTFLLKVLEQITILCGMKKVMLNVLKSNSEAIKFYEAIGYAPDANQNPPPSDDSQSPNSESHQLRSKICI